MCLDSGPKATFVACILVREQTLLGQHSGLVISDVHHLTTMSLFESRPLLHVILFIILSTQSSSASAVFHQTKAKI